MKPAFAIEDAFAEIVASMETPAMRWLRELPKYACPVCGRETIFESGCSEHDDEERA